MKIRTDAIIDKRQVACPNASHLGFDKWRAQVGDLIWYRESPDNTRIGRMIGRVHYAPALGSTPIIRDYILVVALSDTLDHTYERWINPADVLRVNSPRDHKRVLDYFLSDTVLKAPIDEVRLSLADGWSTLDAYRAWKREVQLETDATGHPTPKERSNA